MIGSWIKKNSPVTVENTWWIHQCGEPSRTAPSKPRIPRRNSPTEIEAEAIPFDAGLKKGRMVGLWIDHVRHCHPGNDAATGICHTECFQVGIYSAISGVPDPKDVVREKLRA